MKILFRSLRRLEPLKNEVECMEETRRRPHTISSKVHPIPGTQGYSTKDSTNNRTNLILTKRINISQYRKKHDLKLAFSEYYLMLVLLRNYQTLNYTGFRKILKKHDKLFETTRGEEWR